MSTDPVQGFESPYVLLKLGYDLRDTLKETTEEPVPAELVEKAEAIPVPETGRDVIVLHLDEYRTLDDNLA